MTDQPPRKPSSPVKWIALGCGCLFLLLAGVGGVLGFLGFKVSKEINELGGIGEAYLRGRSEVTDEFGALRKVERQTLRFNVQIRNDQGSAYFAYDVEGEKGAGEADVWLERSSGVWRGTGAMLHREGRSVPVGAPGVRPAIKKLDD